MSQLYSRVFLKILDSSLAEDWEVRHVFEDFLKLASQDGVVDVTREAFARRTNASLELVNRAISILESPDPKSRDAEHEGRRLLRMDGHRDWGWYIANFDKFEAIRNKEDQRSVDRTRKRDYRSRVTTSPPAPPEDTKRTPSPASDSATTSASAPGHQGQVSDTSRTCPGQMPENGHDIEPPRGMPRSESEARASASFIGCPDDFAAQTYHLAASRGWRDSRGVLLANWRAYLKTQWTYQENAKVERKNGLRDSPKIRGMREELAEKERMLRSMTDPQSRQTYEARVEELRRSLA